MHQIIKKYIILQILIFVCISVAFADSDEDYEIDEDLFHSIASAIDNAYVAVFDMTSMDVEEGDGCIYLITEDKSGFAFHICEISENRLINVLTSRKLLYQDRGVPDTYIETDGEVTIFYETGDAITIIDSDGLWQLEGYRVINENKESIDIGFINDQMIEYMIKDPDGKIEQQASLIVVHHIPLRFEDIDIFSLPQTLTEVKQLTL